jgi:hypothetical protein
MLRMCGLAAVILLSGCDRSVSPAEQKRKDAADVAAVEAIQKVAPPIKPINLQRITLEEITAKNLSGAGCSFSTSSPAQPLVLALVGRALIKVDDTIVMLISDNGGAKLEMGAWEHYLGKEYTLTLKRVPGPGQPAGEESLRYAGEVTVRDAWDRVIYSAQGILDCGA